MTPKSPMWASPPTPPPRMARFLLLHSPLVGPRTVSPLAEALERLGHRAAAPDLRSAISADGLSTTALKAIVVQAIARLQSQESLILAVHSGAGAYLPLLTPRLDVAGQVLIDAVVPPANGTFRPSSDFRSELDRLVEADGRLPPWPQWWSAEVFAQVVPDPDLRAAIGGECPRLPISFYDKTIEVPSNWARPWVGYLRLSEAYEAQASTAAARGWPIHRRAGGHLDIATRPDEVALDLSDLVQPALDGWSQPVQ